MKRGINKKTTGKQRKLEFTPLEFETPFGILKNENNDIELEFTPLEFETKIARCLECSL